MEFNQAEDEIVWAQEVLTIEKQALKDFSKRLGNEFIVALNTIEKHVPPGRVVVLGMGKSGHIGNKIAATLASTGTPAFFVHPAEAGHGDLGMISPQDVVIAISQSGSSDELLRVLPYFKRHSIPVIALTGKKNSPLAKHAEVIIDTSVKKEACPHGLAPTASTTVVLAAGDALAMCLLKRSGFMPDDFAERHPHGELGRRLLVDVKSLMQKGKDLPKVLIGSLIGDCLVEMTKGTVGAVAIVDKEDMIHGVFTDGDLRRAISLEPLSLESPVEKFMTEAPQCISPDKLAVEAVDIMEKYKVNLLLVSFENSKLLGIINMRMLIHAGVV